MIDRDHHVGELLIALDISSGTSPALEAVLPATADAEQVAQSIEAAFVETLRRTLGPTLQFSRVPLRVRVNSRSGIIAPRDERERIDAAGRAEWSALCDENTERLRERMAAHPDNGRLGFWRVEGMRHKAIVRASSAPEAVEKALEAGVVGDWEDAEADFIGAEMPDVWPLRG